MSGHSKWANIKHRKGRQDAKRGKVFTKLIRAITVTAKNDGDINSNSALRLAVDKALSQNMPKDTIDRAIARGVGNSEGSNLEEVIYEGYGPCGVAVLIECLTDNKKRTVADVRHAFTKAGGNLGTSGSVSYLFKKRGVLLFAPDSDEDKIMEISLDYDADDVIINEDGSMEVYTLPDNFTAMKDSFSSSNIEFDQAEITMVPTMQVTLDDDAATEKLLRLTDSLEELDDVQSVYSNAIISSDIL